MNALRMGYFALADKDCDGFESVGGHDGVNPRTLLGKSSLNVYETQWKGRALSDGPTWASPGSCGSKQAGHHDVHVHGMSAHAE